jgi:hypothetical protein
VFALFFFEIIKIDNRIALQNITIVEQDDLLIFIFPFLPYKVGYMCQRVIQRLVVDEIVWKNTTMDVGGFNNFDD